ncbi:MAG TPA: hypothetical protein VNT01_15010 [Symbiobacteriaceae bacterium]|nr:hypothetical protein [Symbiobacteriaceae bacterium]
MKMLIAAVTAALLMVGCSVRIDAGGRTTDVEVKVPEITVTLPQAGPGNPGTVPVDVGLPKTADRMEIRLAQTIGNVVLDSAGGNALSGQVSYWRTAPTVTTDQTGGTLSVRIPAEKNVTKSDNTRIPDTVLHVGARVPVSMEVEGAMGDISLDLRGLHVTSLRIKSAMGNIRLTVPSAANVRIFYQAALGSSNLSAAGFTRNGDYWQSPGFKNDQVVEISVEIAMGELHVTR